MTASHFSFAFCFCLAMPRSYFGTPQAVQDRLLYLYVIVRSFLFFFYYKEHFIKRRGGARCRGTLYGVACRGTAAGVKQPSTPQAVSAAQNCQFPPRHRPGLATSSGNQPHGSTGVDKHIPRAPAVLHRLPKRLWSVS